MKKTASIVLACAISLGAFTGSAQAASELETAVDKLIGTRYKYAGNTTDGFDCSGFTHYVFGKFGIDLPRRSSDQADIGEKIGKDELRPGDLVFFNTNGKNISHVGIYMGDGMMAHASTNHGVIIGSINDSYYSKRYVTARRILDGNQYESIAVDREAAADNTAVVISAAEATEASSTAQ